MLSASLGPGLLGTVYDGLQNPLKTLADRDGFFLRRGRYVEPLDNKHKWAFTPTRRAGERLRAGDPLGTVQERHLTHKIMVPFAEPGEVELTRIQSGKDATEAASEVVSQSALPLLGATAVAILAFAAIGTSEDSTGEFCRSLYQVVLVTAYR